MASNPRKFSEKIALHNQKQMEETAAFEKIMREVSNATSKVSVYHLSNPFLIRTSVKIQSVGIVYRSSFGLLEKISGLCCGQNELRERRELF